MRRWLLACALLAAALPAWAEPDVSLRVEYSNPKLTPATWTLLLRPDGSGHFHAERGDAAVDPARGIQPVSVDRDVRVSGEFAGRVFETVQRHRGLRGVSCESHMKVAFEGWKTLTYTGPDGTGSCQFNYSKDKEIQALGESLVAVASTIVEGARLELLLEHDPLGLDQEMVYLQEGAQEGQLQEIVVIRGILEKLEEDPSVMDLVRRRARTLLADAAK